MSYKNPTTIRDVLYIAYANISAAHALINGAALGDGVGFRRYIYDQHYKGDTTPVLPGDKKKGMSRGALSDDKKIQKKFVPDDKCYYCLEQVPKEEFTEDHLITKSAMKKIKDQGVLIGERLKTALAIYGHGDNTFPVCGGCNSSKGNKDLVVWWRDRFNNGKMKQPIPPLFLLRPYLKLQFEWCYGVGIIDCPFPGAPTQSLLPVDGGSACDNLEVKMPFVVDALYKEFPLHGELGREWLKYMGEEKKNTPKKKRGSKRKAGARQLTMGGATDE